MSAIVFIPLTQGKVAVVDFEDFEKVRPYKWHVNETLNIWYACCRIARRRVYLHRLITNASCGQSVDHRDGNGLNNVRTNLRICSHAQNLRAHQHKPEDATSQFRGVDWDNRRKLWRARIRQHGKEFWLGRFSSQRAAAQAYDKKARELFGEFADPNFPL